MSYEPGRCPRFFPLSLKSPTMTKYECDVCSWVYDPEKGDPEQGVAPGTAFEDIPDGWVCPDCGVDKDKFSPVA